LDNHSPASIHQKDLWYTFIILYALSLIG